MIADEEIDPMTVAVVEQVMQSSSPLDQKLQALASSFQLIAALHELEVKLAPTGIFHAAGNGLMRIRRNQ